MSRECTIDDITIRPDCYYRINSDGTPDMSSIVSDGNDNLYYCNKCGDINYNYNNVLEHLARQDTI